MKASEKDSDRRAEIHVHVQGEHVEELAEHGQYVDPSDGALCCYIAVSEGDVIKMTGRFQGTTLQIAHDLLVDGVLRKSYNTTSKAVKHHKGVKLDTEKALFQIDGEGETNIIDTNMKVAPVSDFNFIQGDEPESLGTIELRLYILRTFGVEHSLGSNVKTYMTEENTGENDTDEDANEDDPATEKGGEKHQKDAKFTIITPDFMIDFEKNCQEIDRKMARNWKKKMTAKRPGEQPWAIFRFHYRSKDAIDDPKFELKLTHNPKTKGKGEEYHILDLDPVPALSIGAKPIKGEDSQSTRASSNSPDPSRSPLSQRTSSPLAKRLSGVEDTLSETHVVKELIKRSDFQDSAESSLIDAKAAAPTLKDVDTVEPFTAPTLKRTASPPTKAASPETKRPRPRRSTSATPPPKAASSDIKLTRTSTLVKTQRQLESMRSRRTAIAKQRSELDSQLEYYSAQMREEEERLQKELDEETRAYKEELQSLEERTTLLEYFKCKEEGD